MEKPQAPDVAKYLREGLGKQSPEQLRAIASYASALADWREHEIEEELEEQAVESEPVDEDRPDDVPGKATITIKTINDNRYYYYQWREGDKIKSKYKGPVDSS